MIFLDNKINLINLFKILFKINAVTFGGGYTILPIIKDEFSDKLNLIDEDEMLDIIAISQSGPGPMAINTSLLLGFKLRGIKGAITCLIASVLPCLITISLVFYIYKYLINNPLAKAVLDTMSGSVTAILFITVYSMAKKALSKNKGYGIIIFIISLLLSLFIKVNAIYIILSSAISGLLYFSIIDLGCDKYE